MNIRSASFALAAALTGASAQAQEFNIDVGCTLATNPTNAYGGAAAQPGVWNWANAEALGAWQGMHGLAGGAAIMGLRITGGNGCYSFDNAATAGDDERLMDDIEDIGGAGAVSTYEFAGLAAGPYWIYTYAWAPDDPAAGDWKTKISVAGSLDPDQEVGGNWPGAQSYGVTFARHFVFYAGGPPLVVTATTTVGFGSINGFQISTGPCEIPILYGTSEPNSDGCTPVVSYAGAPSLAAAAAGVAFWIVADDVKAATSGTLFFSRVGPAAAPFTDWTRWVVFPPVRTGVINSGGAGACGGTFAFDFNDYMDDYNNTPVPPADPFMPGDGVWAQYWSRDPADPPANSNLTRAIHFTVCP